MAVKCIHRLLSLILLLLVASVILLIVQPIAAQGSPPDVPTLGPIVYFYTDYSGQNINIISPKNGGNYSGEIQLNFSLKVNGAFGQFGNVGYSIDNGTITSVRNFTDKTVNQTGFPDWYWWTTTAYANVVLPKLPGGVHNVTVYYGWQYLGIPKNPSLERFEVFTLRTVKFTVARAPPPTITQLSIVNQTYDNPAIPLSFCIDSEPSWIAYDLDNKGNITIQGNTTITGLTPGSHSIVVFASDTAGYIGKTDTITFEVKNEVLLTTIDLGTIAITLIVIGVGVSSLVYFAKFRKKQVSFQTVTSFLRV
jgi:hypothetical protein